MKPQYSHEDTVFAQRALENADKPFPPPHPNPKVGCVIVKDGTIIGEGYHCYAGAAHAEIAALNNCQVNPKNAVMYVTLEPCNIYGRTPPCVDRIIDAKLARVVVCAKDPNKDVNGKGIERLQEAGIHVDTGLLHDQACELNRGYYHRHLRGRPWVTVKIAMTLDGKVAAKSGQSKWITGERSRDNVHWIRARSSAILTGSGTLNADNPRLNCRLDTVTSEPLRVVVDSHLEISPNSKLFSVAGPVLVATSSNASAQKRKPLESVAKIVEISSTPDGIDCEKLLNHLALHEQINDVLVEAGPTLVGNLLENKLVDELIIYLAPSLLGHQATPMALLKSVEGLEDRICGKFTDVEKFGEDLRITVKIDDDATID